MPNDNPSGAGAFDFPLRFPGQYYDRETNHAYNYVRDYDPNTGRYIESDPIALLGGLDTYVYANDPTSQIDPHGLMGSAPGTYGKGSPVLGPRFPGSSCGPEGDPRNYPNNLGFGNFNSACDAHDACYETCGANKLKCDLNLGIDIIASTRVVRNAFATRRLILKHIAILRFSNPGQFPMKPPGQICVEINRC